MINIPQRILLGPGPSDTPARVLEALGRPTIGHLDPIFLQLMDDIRAKLKEVFRTKNDMTMAMSGDRKSTRLNSSHANISYAVFCLKKKNLIIPSQCTH